MTTGTATQSPDSFKRLRQWVLPMLFTLLGVPFGSWASRIPAVRDALQLSASQLGLVLLCGGVGAIVSFPFSAWMLAHFGARRTALYSGIGILAFTVAMPAAPHALLLMAAMVGFGTCASVFDVAINFVGAEVEKSAERSIMSILHAWYCVGTFAGALAGSAMATLAFSPTHHFALVATLLAPLLWIGYLFLPDDEPVAAAEKKLFSLPRGPLVTLGIIGFCAAIAEGSIADWSGIFLMDHLHAGDGVAPLAYAAFAIMMLFTRIVGDRLKDRFGARKVVIAGSLLSAAGVFLAVLAPNVATAVIGFALSGAGVAATFPFVFSAAGRHGSTALAGIATVSYSGALIGPPAVGFIAEGLGLPMGIAFIGSLNLAVAIAAGRASMLE